MDLWSVSLKDAVDAKTYMGSRGDWTRTWKRYPLGVTDSINHVKLRKSPKNSWKLRQYSGLLLLLIRCPLQLLLETVCLFLWPYVLEQQLSSILIHIWIMSKVHISWSCVTGTTWHDTEQEHNMLVSFFPFSFTSPPQQYCGSSWFCYSSLGQRMNDVCISLRESLKEFLFEPLFELLHKGHASLHRKQNTWGLWTYFRVLTLKQGLPFTEYFGCQETRLGLWKLVS